MNREVNHIESSGSEVELLELLTCNQILNFSYKIVVNA